MKEAGELCLHVSVCDRDILVCVCGVCVCLCGVFSLHIDEENSPVWTFIQSSLSDLIR